MKKKKSSLPLLGILLIGLSLLGVLWPLLRPGFYISDDGEWMVIRLSAFYQSLADGQFPVRFLGRLNNSYGYPVANFLYPGFLYIGSLFRLLGLSFSDAVKLILGLSVVGAAASVFMALRTRYRFISSLIGTFSFIFAPYLLYDMYHRGSVGEVLAIGAASLAVLSLMKRWGWLLTLAVALLIVSHNTVALITGIAIAGLIVIDKDRSRMMLSAALGVGMAAFFWLPALAEQYLVRFHTVAVSDPTRYFITVENAALLGLTTLIALPMIGKLIGKPKEITTLMAGFVVVGVLLALPISAPLWRMIILRNLIQFPYRFLVLPVIFGPWIVAAASERLHGWKLALLFGVFLLLWVQGAAEQIARIQFVDRPIGYYTTNEGTTNVANEYMPRWVSDIPKNRPVETLEVIDGDAVLSARTFTGEYMKVNIEAKETSVVQINKIYYPGWGISIDGKLTPIDYRNGLGVMRVEVPQGAHTLVAAFRETPFRLAADLVSVVSVILYMVLLRRYLIFS